MWLTKEQVDMIPEMIKKGFTAKRIGIELNVLDVTIDNWVKKRFSELIPQLRENRRKAKGWNIKHGGLIGERQKYKYKKDKCEICNKKEKLVLHHKNKVIYDEFWNPKIADNSPENLQTLCASCHLKLHYKMGRPVNKQINTTTGQYVSN